MLISFSFDNVASFKEAQNLTLEVSPLKKDNFLSENTIQADNQDEVLKSLLIYGANASGKTNINKAVEWLRTIVLDSYRNLEQNLLLRVMPFILDMKNVNSPSKFEVIFLQNNIKYRYGISVSNGEILEEWLYTTPKIRETLLFFRDKQIVEFNKSSFDEAKLFIKSDKNSDSTTRNSGTLEKTAPHIPFISVLAVFQGKHSSNVISFFNRLHVISGLEDQILSDYTFSLIKNNPDFYRWTVNILKNFNIADLLVSEEEFNQQIQLPQNADEKNSPSLMGPINIQGRRMNVRVKKLMNHSEEMVEIPLELESAGTRKIIHLLGPIYDTIKSGNVLFIDEFDSKFHTLLSKYIFKIFHKQSSNSQIIANVQDTNLMDTSIFRRDQIWFVHKDEVEQDSQIYSLAEYKNTIKESYSDDYLNGNFDAIPLFSSYDQIEHLMVD